MCKFLGGYLFHIARKISDNVLLFLVLKQGLLGLFNLVALFTNPGVKPPNRILGGSKLDFQVLIYIGACKGVSNPGGQHRVFGLKADIHKTAITDRGHLYPADKSGYKGGVWLIFFRKFRGCLIFFIR